VSIVIVAFGTGLVLDRCLESLADACAADGIAAEVIVVDNAHPRRGHAAGHRVAISTRGIRLMQPDDNLGFGGGNNAGVAAARAPMIALVNPDVMVVPGQLPALLDEARDHPQSICAPALSFPDGTVQEIGMRIISDGDTRPILESGSHAPDYASAACWVLSSELFTRLGGFDAAFHPAYYEDVDFALRVAAAGGGTRIVESVRVVHEHHSSTTDAEPDVARQRDVFVNRWADLVASRPDH
jgi:GT2 family glycosyltransferase